MSRQSDQYTYNAFDTYLAGASSNSLPLERTQVSHVAFISCEGADVTFRLDSGDAAVAGHVLHPGDTYTCFGSLNLRKFRYAGVGGTLRVSYGIDTLL